VAGRLGVLHGLAFAASTAGDAALFSHHNPDFLPDRLRLGYAFKAGPGLLGVGGLLVLAGAVVVNTGPLCVGRFFTTCSAGESVAGGSGPEIGLDLQYTVPLFERVRLNPFATAGAGVLSGGPGGRIGWSGVFLELGAEVIVKLLDFLSLRLSAGLDLRAYQHDGENEPDTSFGGSAFHFNVGLGLHNILFDGWTNDF
jgi:hypothetical protein